MTIFENINKSLREYMNSFFNWILIAGVCGAVSLAFTFLALPYMKKLNELSLLEPEKIYNMNIQELNPYFIASVAFLSIYALNILVAYMFNVGAFKCALESTRGRKIKTSDIFFAFKKKPWKFLGLYIWKFILLSLWSCLFIIPGIIKYFSYSQALFLMIENPDYGINESIKESQMLMSGHKEKFFMLWFISIALMAVLVIIPLVGAGLFTFFAFPFANLLYMNFYNDITLYNQYNDDEYKDIEI
ncbi:DUF975 family protein [Sebaldella sp. S0638]|uniref:DUF975 family protein n=1 Tax=Sebaldella sp. S0638 TaxID=2957809 RepID=UPI00209DEBCE|nr:DUF975 family protein [Sebaldella sp. S0638]MCP1223098.1 DUF975 family protein [Sebaldella sp. S0638]